MRRVWRQTAHIGLAVVLLTGLLTSAGPREPVRAGGELLPDLAMAPLSNFRIEWQNGRRLLKFTAMMVNLGPGHFEVRGGRGSTAEPMSMRQVIYQSTDRNGPIAREVATSAVAQYSGDGHNHWHVQDMMRYDLWDGVAAERGDKVGFCFLDSDRHFGSDPSYYRATWCESNPNVLSNRMGISVGWGDLYAWNFAWQWIDITGLPGGTYAVRATVDPYGWFTETNDANQCTSVTVSWTADSGAVTVHGQEAGCWNDWGHTTFGADIAWAFQTGITLGCHYNLYCPDRPVPREQMASFLARARALPPTSNDYFHDDSGSWHHADINSTAEAGITNGCGDGRYCPTDGVTRGQMASFLTRAFALPPATADYFTDDAGSIHEADINSIAEAGITIGCDPQLYCPQQLVTRGQMAAFLHRAMTD